jgi:hypothetical protein
MTRVFPDPAPARIKSAPSVVVTASRCCALREARISIVFRGKLNGKILTSNGQKGILAKVKQNAESLGAK